jgi:Cu2+-exporting ATPase
VYAGSFCRESPARLRVTRIGEDTRLSQLTRLVERAQAQRPALARAADRVAGWFVLALALAAAAVYLWWRGHEPARAFEVALAVLVVSCPCALSLAVPTALTAVHGALAKLGVLALRPEALPALARADRIVFDKTGTLSDRRPRIAAIETFGCAEDQDTESARAPTSDTRSGEMRFDGMHLSVMPSSRMHASRTHSNVQALAIACALERDSGHPLAAAFLSAQLSAQAMTDASDSTETLQASAVRSVPGNGIAGRIEGIDYRLGRSAWAAAGDARAQGDDDALWLGDGERAFARFRVEETPREDAADALHALRALGLQVEICSGDAQARVLRLARALGVAEDAAHGRRTPEDKLAQVRAHQAAGAVVAMVGDGLNDAPVLAGADVSLALADGAALAQRAADFVVMGDALAKIPQAVALARRSGRIVRQNLAWAVGYNLLALPLAAAGLVTPWMAAVGMALSSLLVTLNALRLARVPAAHAGAEPRDRGDLEHVRDRSPSPAAPADAMHRRLATREVAP